MEEIPDGGPSEENAVPSPEHSHLAYGKGRKLAKWCLWSPFVGLAVWFSLDGVIGTVTTEPVEGYVAVSLLAGVLFVGGITIGVLALKRSKLEGRTGIVVRSMVGISLNGVMLLGVAAVLCSGIYVMRLRSQVRAQEAEGQKKEQTRTVELEQVNVEYKAEMNAIKDRYFANAAALTNHMLDMSSVKSRDEIEARRQIVRDFVEGSKGMEIFATNAPAMYQQVLDKHDFTPRLKKLYLAEFTKSLGNRASDTLQWRPTEVHYGELILQTLDLFYDSWGHWKYYAAKKRVEFQDAKALVEYNSLTQQIKETAAQLNELRKNTQTNAVTAP